MIAAGLTLLGMFALAAAMPRHAPALLGAWERRVPATRLRIGGGALLLAALAATLAAADWPTALVTWCGVLPLSAALVLLGLTYDVRLARGAAALGAVAILAGLLR
jgi:hypothetical protein